MNLKVHLSHRLGFAGLLKSVILLPHPHFFQLNFSYYNETNSLILTLSPFLLIAISFPPFFFLIIFLSSVPFILVVSMVWTKKTNPNLLKVCAAKFERQCFCAKFQRLFRKLMMDQAVVQLVPTPPVSPPIPTQRLHVVVQIMNTREVLKTTPVAHSSPTHPAPPTFLTPPTHSASLQLSNSFDSQEHVPTSILIHPCKT